MAHSTARDHASGPLLVRHTLASSLSLSDNISPLDGNASPFPSTTAYSIPPAVVDDATSQSAPAKASTPDAGALPSDHYREKLPPWRFHLRQACLPMVRKETPILADIQKSLRHPVLDAYFAWTANLASHTFYVLMLPAAFWVGQNRLGRDMVFVLGMGIYVLGFFKDLLCLPRPRLPPLHRITMSSYTAHEYGWPSLHLANATAVTLVLALELWKLDISLAAAVALYAGLLIYWSLLIFGRLYCGMHGFFDVSMGLAIGAALFFLRFFFGPAFDQWLLYSHNGSTSAVILKIAVVISCYLFLVHIYPEPVDDCPCFDDSVAFVGVLMGIDISHLMCVVTGYFVTIPGNTDFLSAPCPAHLTPFMHVFRFVVGVSLVVVWKSILKPVLFSILPPIYKFVGVYLPRSNFISTAHSHKTSRQIRSQSLSNMQNEPMLEFKNVISTVLSGDKDVVGPADDIDVYELLDYQNKHPTEKQTTVQPSGVFRPRYDVEIIGRVIVYFGISAMAIWGFSLSVVAMHLY